MNKADLSEHISRRTQLPKKTVLCVVDAMMDTITQQLSAGHSVTLMGFGTFQTVSRAARTGRNPQTGEVIQIPAANVPSFKAGKALKDALN
jgi:Bacterial nucleoid DNA-binding protein